MENNKERALSFAINQIEKSHGKGSIMKMGQTPGLDISAISSGALSLDLALGVGGFPKGRIIEIYGPESSGKTTLSLTAVAEAQKQGGICAYIDAEHALNPSYAEHIGINLDDLYLSQPDYGEQALEIVETLVRSGAIDLIVIDSVAALVPKSEIEGDMGDAQMGVQAKLMSQALRKLTGIVSKSNCVVIFVNQIREKIGVMFGSPETTPGGRALKFYSTIRMDIRRIESIKSGVDIIGSKVRVKVVKNKVAPPFKYTELEIAFGKGISKTADLLDLGISLNLVEKNGTWFNYNNERMGQGREAAKAYLLDNPSQYESLSKQVATLVNEGRNQSDDKKKTIKKDKKKEVVSV